MTVKCLICGGEFDILTWSHMKGSHGISLDDYREMYPFAEERSEEYRERMSKAFRDNWESASFRENHRRAARDPEKTSRLSRLATENWEAKSPEEKEEHRRKAGESADKRWSDPLAHLRASEVTARSAKEVWDSYSPEEKALRLSSGLHRPDSLLASQKANRGSRNSFEEELVRYLEEDFPGVFTWNRDMTKTIGGRFPDFFSDENQIVVECFGSHWHSFDPDDEERKIEHYRKYGFSCVVIWAHGLMDLAIQWIDCRDQIRSLLKVPVC